MQRAMLGFHVSAVTAEVSHYSTAGVAQSPGKKKIIELLHCMSLLLKAVLVYNSLYYL